MKFLRNLIGWFVVAAAGAGALAKPPPSAWGRAADNKILAQRIVNDLMNQNVDLVVCGLHAVPPGGGENDQRMIACNLDRIGKPDDEDDLAVSRQRKMILVPNAREPDKFEVQVPLKDAMGRIIGACGFVFRYEPGDDEVELLRKGRSLRDKIARQLSSRADLFEPIK
jgi:hypothetical protein